MAIISSFPTEKEQADRTLSNLTDAEEARNNLGGAAAAASIITNLASTAAGLFDGSENITAGVSGTLPVTNGGTGLTSAPSMLVNLASTTAASPLQASPRPGVTGTLPVARGGTGQTSLQATRNAMGLGNTTGALPVANGGTGITTNPSVLVNLASTAAASILATSPRPGITGTLPVANGGTGVTTIDALKTALGLGNVISGNIAIGTYVGGSTSDTTISLGFTPKVVFSLGGNSYRASSSATGIRIILSVSLLQGSSSSEPYLVFAKAGTIQFDYYTSLTSAMSRNGIQTTTNGIIIPAYSDNGSYWNLSSISYLYIAAG